MKVPRPKKRPINVKVARYRLRIARSSLHRYGVFALEDIPPGRRVIEYTGKRLTIAQAVKIRPPKDAYIAGINSQQCVDRRSCGNGAELINHSCQPNFQWGYIRGHLFFFSRKKIHAGEELTWKLRVRRCRGTLRVIVS